MEFRFKVGKKNHTLILEKSKNGFDVEMDGRRETVNVAFVDPNTVSLLLGERIATVHMVSDGDKIYASVAGDEFTIEKGEEPSTAQRFQRGDAHLQGESVVSSPMPGQIVKIQVTEGQMVEPDQNLFIIESMKMENQIRSPLRARVTKIHCEDGDPVEANAPIMQLEAVPDQKAG